MTARRVEHGAAPPGETSGAEPIAQSGDALNQLHRNYRTRPESASRAELAAAYDHLATGLARTYRGRGEAFEDLCQVARIGLLAALDRFDPDRGTRFAAFARPTIVGELRRHFRDRARWRLRVPRVLQEHFIVVARTVDDLTVELGRSPTVSTVAERSGLSEEQVLEAMEVRHAQEVVSLDGVVGDDDSITLSDVVGGDDPGFARVENRQEIASMLTRLPVRQQTILRLRFVDELFQREIGDRIGFSQMQVSRDQAKALARLQALFQIPACPPAAIAPTGDTQEPPATPNHGRRTPGAALTPARRRSLEAP